MASISEILEGDANQHRRTPEATKAIETFYERSEALAREKAEILTEIAARKPLASPLTAKVLDWAIAADPECSNAQFVRGRAALAAKDWVTAALRFAGAANLDKTNAAACVNAAFADDRLDLQPNAVEPWCREAISRDPSYAPAYIQLFGIYERAARHEDAAAILEQGLAACTDQHGLLFCRATLRLGAGDFERGWLDYEHRPSRLKLASLMDEYEEWDGSPLAGKTLFIAREQGFGDEIMFARYLPLLAELGGKVVLHTYPELARLFASVPGVSQVLTCDQDAVEFDVWTTLGSLPLRINDEKLHQIQARDGLAFVTHLASHTIGMACGEPYL